MDVAAAAAAVDEGIAGRQSPLKWLGGLASPNDDDFIFFFTFIRIDATGGSGITNKVATKDV
jgi:hypothetical protein